MHSHATVNTSAPFRLRLAGSILAAVGAASLAAACESEVASVSSTGSTGSSSQGGNGGGVGGGGGAITVTSTGNCYPAAGGDETVICVAWPQPGGAGGGIGGSNPSGPGGTTVAATGAGGAGGAPACPSPADAEASGLLGYGSGCGFAAVSPATFTGTQCCYPATTSCCSGRPFLVADRARTAEVRRNGSGWTGPARPDVDDLDPRTRAFLADAWLGDALLEHASVASFSRFALELLAVGAPSALVAAAHEAARDEVRPARACFALASAYAGVELAPAPFDFGGKVLIGSDLAAVAASAVKEGCIGETLAAVQAAEQLDAAGDPAVREALAAIAADEARHAELAWRFVAWAIETGGEAVRLAVADAFASALAVPVEPAPVPGFAAEVAAHGRVRPAVLLAAFEATIAEAILPGARILARAATREAGLVRPAA